MVKRDLTGSEKKLVVKSSPVDHCVRTVLQVSQDRPRDTSARNVGGADRQKVTEDTDINQLLLQGSPSSCGPGGRWSKLAHQTFLYLTANLVSGNNHRD